MFDDNQHPSSSTLSYRMTRLMILETAELTSQDIESKTIVVTKITRIIKVGVVEGPSHEGDVVG